MAANQWMWGGYQPYIGGNLTYRCPRGTFRDRESPEWVKHRLYGWFQEFTDYYAEEGYLYEHEADEWGEISALSRGIVEMPELQFNMNEFQLLAGNYEDSSSSSSSSTSSAIGLGVQHETSQSGLLPSASLPTAFSNNNYTSCTTPGPGQEGQLLGVAGGLGASTTATLSSLLQQQPHSPPSIFSSPAPAGGVPVSLCPGSAHLAGSASGAPLTTSKDTIPSSSSSSQKDSPPLPPAAFLQRSVSHSLLPRSSSDGANRRIFTRPRQLKCLETFPGETVQPDKNGRYRGVKIPRLVLRSLRRRPVELVHVMRDVHVDENSLHFRISPQLMRAAKPGDASTKLPAGESPQSPKRKRSEVGASKKQEWWEEGYTDGSSERPWEIWGMSKAVWERNQRIEREAREREKEQERQRLEKQAEAKRRSSTPGTPNATAIVPDAARTASENAAPVVASSSTSSSKGTDMTMLKQLLESKKRTLKDAPMKKTLTETSATSRGGGTSSNTLTIDASPELVGAHDHQGDDQSAGGYRSDDSMGGANELTKWRRKERKKHILHREEMLGGGRDKSNLDGGGNSKGIDGRPAKKKKKNKGTTREPSSDFSDHDNQHQGHSRGGKDQSLDNSFVDNMKSSSSTRGLDLHAADGGLSKQERKQQKRNKNRTSSAGVEVVAAASSSSASSSPVVEQASSLIGENERTLEHGSSTSSKLSNDEDEHDEPDDADFSNEDDSRNDAGGAFTSDDGSDYGGNVAPASSSKHNRAPSRRGSKKTGRQSKRSSAGDEDEDDEEQFVARTKSKKTKKSKKSRRGQDVDHRDHRDHRDGLNSKHHTGAGGGASSSGVVKDKSLRQDRDRARGVRKRSEKKKEKKKKRDRGDRDASLEKDHSGSGFFDQVNVPSSSSRKHKQGETYYGDTNNHEIIATTRGGKVSKKRRNKNVEKAAKQVIQQHSEDENQSVSDISVRKAASDAASGDEQSDSHHAPPTKSHRKVEPVSEEDITVPNKAFKPTRRAILQPSSPLVGKRGLHGWPQDAESGDEAEEPDRWRRERAAQERVRGYGAQPSRSASLSMPKNHNHNQEPVGIDIKPKAARAKAKPQMFNWLRSGQVRG
ncbi:unnamed protein product [Amoebophrya sp. A25]|nr:unnamed protein product [Amoebophrya sp. A25]|eukprot:GSA25T00022047001.1